MKKLIVIATLIIVSTFAAFAQNGKDEQEILKISASLDQAYMKKDISVFERVFADDYVYSTPSGKMMNRVQSLEEMRTEWANANYKILSATTDDLKIKVSGNLALVTGNWSYAGVASEANAEPHKDSGRYTGVYEKRAGNWLLVAEHFSEAPHDRKLMEQQVMKAGQDYARMIKNRDVPAIEKILGDEFLYTDARGKVITKTENLTRYKSDPATFEIFEISDQKVRVIGNGAAVETGTVRFKGSEKTGKSLNGSERYTTTWIWRGGRWQIVADHVSEIKQ